ncbi:hypothetical protein BU15DRAFT_48910, partial [Melanogaster broomeanus]
AIALGFFQIALFDLLAPLGLKPDAVVGQSVGETTVLLCLWHCPSQHIAVELVIACGRALATDNTGDGMMVVSGCDANVPITLPTTTTSNPNRYKCASYIPL